MLLSVSCGAFAASSQQAAGTVCADIAVPDVRCTTVTVVENRVTGKGRTIALRVAVLPARGSGRAPDPVFFLAGGPGQAATDMLGDPGMSRHPAGERRDLVFLDQRGTGLSSPLICNLYPPADYARGRFANFMPIDRVRACRRALEGKADLTQYTTAVSVADIEETRKALGHQRINLAGTSYGTRLAMEYLRTHPANVRSVMLDGAVPPSLKMPDGFGRAAQQALDGLLDECAGTAACGQAFPDIRARSREVFERLARAPITTRLKAQASSVTMTRNNVAEAIRYMTYSSREASRVPRLLHRAHQGDFTGIAEYLFRRRTPGTFEALYLSITCTEDVPFSPQGCRRPRPANLSWELSHPRAADRMRRVAPQKGSAMARRGCSLGCARPDHHGDA
ncbi:MAG: alpha/beta fold hydrolase [Gemmatimonadaceae bacterium]